MSINLVHFTLNYSNTYVCTNLASSSSLMIGFILIFNKSMQILKYLCCVISFMCRKKEYQICYDCDKSEGEG